MYRLGKLPEGQLLAVLQWLKGRRPQGRPQADVEIAARKPRAVEAGEPLSPNSR